MWKPSSAEDWAIINKTETMLYQTIEIALSTNKQLRCSFQGFYRSPDREPSHGYWKECNPAVSFAIDKVCKELSSKGWNPYLVLSHHYYSLNIYCWLGGNVMTVECDLH